MAPRIIDPRIKIRHLACFLEVARLRSMVSAAEVLNISQPAATKTIQELEDVLGGALFDRSKRRLALTPFGDTFYRYASTSIAALRQGIDAARGSQTGATVKLGALPTVSARMLPEAVRNFLATEPGIKTQIITGPNSYLLTLLRTGDVDLVIGRMAEPAEMVGLTFEHLYSEPVVLAVRPEHPLLSARDFNLGMIDGFQRLMPTPGAVIRPLVERMLIAHGVSGHSEEIETVSNAFGRAYVRQSDAIWFISEGVVATDLAENYLAKLPVDMSETQGPVGLTTRSDTPPSLAISAFMATVRTVAASLRNQPERSLIP